MFACVFSVCVFFMAGCSLSVQCAVCCACVFVWFRSGDVFARADLLRISLRSAKKRRRKMPAYVCGVK